MHKTIASHRIWSIIILTALFKRTNATYNIFTVSRQVGVVALYVFKSLPLAWVWGNCRGQKWIDTTISTGWLAFVHTTIALTDRSIPQLVYGQTDKQARQVLLCRVLALYICLFRSHLLQYGETVADRSIRQYRLVDIDWSGPPRLFPQSWCK